MVSVGTVLVAAVTLLGSVGLVFEVGRRIGRGAVERETTTTDVDELEDRIEDRFDELDRRLRAAERVRARKHRVLVRWLSNISSALTDEDFDIEEPEEIHMDITLEDRDAEDKVGED